MKTKRNLLAVGAGIAFLCNQPVLATEDIYTDLPDEHQGARHFLFTGTLTNPSYSDEGTPTPDGYGFRNAKGSTQLTLSVPDLGITDLLIAPLVVEINADRDADGNGTTWGGLRPVIDKKYAGRLYFTGADHKVSDTLTTHTRQFGGCFWGGPLNGAHLLATEQIEDTTESDGTVISSISIINGVLIVPWYEGFAPYDAMGSLPPLKPLTELPAGLGWRPYALSARDNHGDSGHIWEVTMEELGIVDLRIRNRAYLEGPNEKFKPVYGKSDHSAMGHSSEPFGKTVHMGVRGTGSNVGDIVHHEIIGVFWAGPFAGCLILESRRWPNPIESGVLLVPDTVDLDAPQKLLNVSERGRVGTGDDILIAGFVVSGNLPKMMLIRGVGPGLAQFGVTDFLPDPELKVYRTTEAGPVLVGSNDNWGSGYSAEIRIVTGEVGAFELDSGSLDAAILFSWLEPGAYTVQVSGVGGATGVALAEVYEIGN